jgi:hypothetical protein
MDDQTRKDLEKIRQRAQEQRDHVRKLRLEAEAAEEAAALAAEEDDLAFGREMFGAGFMKAINEPAKFDIDPDVANRIIRAAGRGNQSKAKRIARQNRKQLSAGSAKAKGGCLSAFVMLVMTAPAVATAVTIAVHYL